jgi:hypothetical protein
MLLSEYNHFEASQWTFPTAVIWRDFASKLTVGQGLQQAGIKGLYRGV